LDVASEFKQFLENIQCNIKKSHFTKLMEHPRKNNF